MDVTVVQDKRDPSSYRVEAIDDDGGCEVAIFSGPNAQKRATSFLGYYDKKFEYRLGEITDGNNRPVSDRAFIEIVNADDPLVMLGEINIEVENADMHARKIVAALSAKPL